VGDATEIEPALAMRRFPGAAKSSDECARQEDPTAAGVPRTPAFDDLAQRADACGLVELAGKAVGASFVGVIAACLAVAESVRELHGGPGHDVLRYDLLTATHTAAPAAQMTDIVSMPLSG
jgi:hypothetical protein